MLKQRLSSFVKNETRNAEEGLQSSLADCLASLDAAFLPEQEKQKQLLKNVEGKLAELVVLKEKCKERIGLLQSGYVLQQKELLREKEEVRKEKMREVFSRLRMETKAELGQIIEENIRKEVINHLRSLEENVMGE